MGQEAKLKELRKQIRTTLKEMGRDFLMQHLSKDIQGKVMSVVNDRLDKIDGRQRDLASLLVRSAVARDPGPTVTESTLEKADSEKAETTLKVQDSAENQS
jgi:hypothetical protein